MIARLCDSEPVLRCARVCMRPHRQCLQLKKDQMMERLEWLIVLILSLEVGLSLRHWFE